MLDTCRVRLVLVATRMLDFPDSMATTAVSLGVMPALIIVAWSSGDAVTLVVWAVLAVLSLRLVCRLPVGRRGAWYVVSVYCASVAVDKVVDLQMVFWRIARGSVSVRIDRSRGTSRGDR